MIEAEVAVLTDAASVQRSVGVLAHLGLLGTALGVVAILAHTVCVVGLRGVLAP